MSRDKVRRDKVRKSFGVGMSALPEISIPPEIADSIRKHGAETYPHECCGALLGRDTDVARQLIRREIKALFPLLNRRDDSPRNRFSVTSADVRDAEKAGIDSGLDVVGWYHSHPDHPARPSQYDLDHAWPWYSYIIVAVGNRIPGEMTSWRLRDDRTQFDPETLVALNRAAT
ncbi:MAG: M67 family metallopeptidase [Candidatus Acidiferrum sp.]